MKNTANSHDNLNNQYEVKIESVDLEGKGVAHIEGKTIFINGALPQELVLTEIYKRKSNFDLGHLINIIEPSPDRVEPECPNFGICGGCSQQHIKPMAQILNKQQVLIDNLKHIGKITIDNILPPLTNDKPWGYRHRARLSARFVNKKNSVLVGFREKGSPYVTNMTECRILPQHISELLPELRELIGKLSIKASIPQIEVAIGDKVSVLVFRIMESLPEDDANLIKQFIDKYHNQNSQHNQNNTNNSPKLQIWLQPKGPDSCYPFYPTTSDTLSYSLPEFAIEMPYYPAEFTQVNPILNERMVKQAINLLDLKSEDKVIDFFCGIGNFTLAIARTVAQVTGIEGSEVLVKRAKENAKHNNLTQKTNYLVTDLFKIDTKWLQQLGKQDKWLIDPPRDGCFDLVKSITPEIAPEVIVYVSCNPATLARDADILVHTKEYQLYTAGVMDMFPHTSHVESIAVFKKNNCK